MLTGIESETDGQNSAADHLSARGNSINGVAPTLKPKVVKRRKRGVVTQDKFIIQLARGGTIDVRIASTWVQELRLFAQRSPLLLKALYELAWDEQKLVSAEERKQLKVAGFFGDGDTLSDDLKAIIQSSVVIQMGGNLAVGAPYALDDSLSATKWAMERRRCSEKIDKIASKLISR